MARSYTMDLSELRNFCLSFPNTREDIKWGTDLCFVTGGKMFCRAPLEPPVNGAVSFRCTPEKFEELVARDGIEPDPQGAHYKWVLVEDIGTIEDDELEDLITKSFMLALDKASKE